MNMNEYENEGVKQREKEISYMLQGSPLMDVHFKQGSYSIDLCMMLLQ